MSYIYMYKVRKWLRMKSRNFNFFTKYFCFNLSGCRKQRKKEAFNS